MSVLWLLACTGTTPEVAEDPVDDTAIDDTGDTGDTGVAVESDWDRVQELLAGTATLAETL